MTGDKTHLLITAVGILFICQGCTLLFPSHPRSNAREKEDVVIELLPLDQMQAYKSLYKDAFGKDLPDPKVRAAVPLAALGSLAVGFAIDLVKNDLEREAELHEAQYSSTIADDKFWKSIPQTITTEKTTAKTTTKSESTEDGSPQEGGFTFKPPRTKTVENEVTEVIQKIEPKQGFQQRYYGFKVTRYVKRDHCKAQSTEKLCQAAEILFGINPSADEQMFRIAPLSFSTSYAKAKVISDELLSYVWPPLLSLVGKGLRFQGHTIDVDIAVEITAFWRGKDHLLSTAKVAAFQTKVAGYDISHCETAPGSNECRPLTLTPGKGLNKAAAGWLVGVPISFDPEGKPAVGSGARGEPESGTFSLKVVVTERDSSNAKQLLERAAELVGQQKEKIQQQISR